MTDSSLASRLCNACGMCCNGVMFEAVELQGEDSVRELTSLGLRLKYKRRKYSFAQPCAAYQGCGCKIYEGRPRRCRAFECRLLQRALQGKISEGEAISSIEEVKERVGRIYAIFESFGNRNGKRALKVRYEKIMEEPTGDFSSEESLRRREQLKREVEELEAILRDEFRIPK